MTIKKPSTDNTTQPDDTTTAPTPDQKSEAGADAPASIALDAHHEQVQKARQEEKAKLYPDLESARASEAQAKQLAKEAQAKADAAERELRELKQAELSDHDKVVATRLEDLERKAIENKEAAAKADREAKEENQRLRNELYRERKLRESKISDSFADLVQGGTPEEIDASIKAVAEREAAVEARIDEEVAKKLAEARGESIPEGSHGGDPTDSKTKSTAVTLPTAKERENLVRLPSADYQQQRAERLAAAKKSIPAGHKYGGR